MKLFVPLRAQLAKRIESKAKEIADEADLDTEPSDNFDELTQTISAIEELFDNDDAMSGPVSDSRAAIDEAVERIEERQRDNSARREEWDWEARVPTHNLEKKSETPARQQAALRSIFSDVDK